MEALQAGAPFPKQDIPQVGGDTLTLGAPRNGHDWQLVIIYRGLHCPLCNKYLTTLEGLLPRFHDNGIDVVVASGDPVEKAQAMAEELGLTVPVGYGLSVAQMRALGVYVTDPRSPQETDAQWTSRLVASELQFRQGKQNASFWISLVHFEMDDAEACADWLVNRIIKANDGRGSWVRSANYNLSRVHEANGDYEAARRILLTDESPQALGNRVRARLIREWREREAASGGQAADQEKADGS